MADERFVGEILMLPYGNQRAPTGYFLCNGQLLSIQQYTALFAILGTTYGGNGTSNFALPNLMGATVVGVGQGPGLGDQILGQSGGSASTSLTTSNLPYHSHIFSQNPMSLPVGGVATTANPAGGYFSEMATGNGYGVPLSTTSGIEVISTMQLGATGVAQAQVNNMQPSLVVIFVIAYQGIFPS